MDLKKDSKKYRFLIWYATHILKVPFIVDFTPAERTLVYAVGFAWSAHAADRMRGDEMIIERMIRAEKIASVSSHSRSARRALNRAAKKAAKKEVLNAKKPELLQ